MTFELTPEPEMPPPPRKRTLADHIDGKWWSPILSLTVLGLICWGVWSLAVWAFHAIFGGADINTPQNRDGPESARHAEQYASPTNEPAASSAPSNTVVMAGAMSSIKRKLVDPGSARFRNVRAYPQASGTTAVCGEVNAKNRAGGYNGYQRFISAGIDKYTWLENEMEDMESAWATFCK